MLFITAAVAVFILTWLLVPLNIKVSAKLGLIDEPKQDSVHKEPKPLSGGLSITIPIVVALLAFNLLLDFPATPNTIPFIVGCLGIMISGIIDDRYKLPAHKKLIFQIIIAIYMYYGGFQITLLTNPWNNAISLGLLSFPVTVLWFVLLINAFNLIDGIDGLATGIAAVVSLIMVMVAFRYGNMFLFFSALIFLAANAGFLIYNFPPAKIFLGDAGSQLLGFYFAGISITGNMQYKGITAITLLIPIIVMFIPLADVILAVLRRIRYKKNIFRGDRHHLHHKLMRIGMPFRTINYVCYFTTFLFGLIAIGFSFADKNILFTILISLAVLVFIVLYQILRKELRK